MTGLKFFMKKYINKLHPDIRSNWYNFYTANFYFNKNEFDNSLKFISRVNFDTPIFNIKAKDFARKFISN
jgi:hypothetical protein